MRGSGHSLFQDTSSVFESVKKEHGKVPAWFSLSAAEIRKKNLSNACEKRYLLELTSSVSYAMILETKCWQFG